jgi:hypothetical protein
MVGEGAGGDKSGGLKIATKIRCFIVFLLKQRGFGLISGQGGVWLGVETKLVKKITNYLRPCFAKA